MSAAVPTLQPPKPYRPTAHVDLNRGTVPRAVPQSPRRG